MPHHNLPTVSRQLCEIAHKRMFRIEQPRTQHEAALISELKHVAANNIR